MADLAYLIKLLQPKTLNPKLPNTVPLIEETSIPESISKPEPEVKQSSPEKKTGWDKAEEIEDKVKAKAKEATGKAKEVAKQTASKAKEAAKKVADTTLRDVSSKAVQGAKVAGRATLNLGRNALSGLSGLGDVTLGSIARTAGPVAALGAMGYEGLKAAGDYAADVQREREAAGLREESPVNYGLDGTITDPETGLEWNLPGRGNEAVSQMALRTSEPEVIMPTGTAAYVASMPLSEVLAQKEAQQVPNQASTQADLDYLRSQGVIADSGADVVPAQATKVVPTAPVIANPISNLSNLSDDAIAKAVIAGKYGNGADRKAALGDRYAAVQALVNDAMAKDSARRTAVKPTTVAINTGKGVVHYDPKADRLLETDMSKWEDGVRDQVF